MGTEITLVFPFNLHYAEQLVRYGVRAAEHTRGAQLRSASVLLLDGSFTGAPTFSAR
jgi:hypothetical protein